MKAAKLKHTLKLSSRSSTGSRSNSTKSEQLPLKDIVFYVDTLNEDGTDASLANTKLIEALGGSVSTSFGEHIKYLIWSNYSNEKRLMTAQLMDIVALSPLWLESCREANEIVLIDDFLITSASKNSSSSSSSKITEPKVNQVKELRSIDSPFFSSSQRPDEKSAVIKDKVGLSKKATNKAKPLAEISSNVLKAKVTKRGIIDDDEDEDDVVVAVKPSETKATSVAVASKESTSAGKATSSFIDIPSDDESEAEFDENGIPYKTVTAAAPSVETVPAKKYPIPTVTVQETTESSTSKSNKIATTTTVTEKQVKKSNKKSPIETDKVVKVSKTSKKIGASASSSSSSSPKPKSIVISVSGFDDEAVSSGEKDTIENALKLLIVGMSKQGKEECKYVDDDAKPDAVSTHIIAHSSSSKRSLRILFAIARGTPIVTEEWLYNCIEKSQWVDTNEYRHSRYCHLSVGMNQSIFVNQTYHVGASSNLNKQSLEKLIRFAGGNVVASYPTTTNADTFIVFGLDSDVTLPFVTAVDKKQAVLNKVVNSKYIFDCLEAGRLLDACDSMYAISIDTDTSIKTKSSSSVKSKCAAAAAAVTAKEGKGKKRDSLSDDSAIRSNASSSSIHKESSEEEDQEQSYELVACKKSKSNDNTNRITSARSSSKSSPVVMSSSPVIDILSFKIPQSPPSKISNHTDTNGSSKMDDVDMEEDVDVDEDITGKLKNYHLKRNKILSQQSSSQASAVGARNNYTDRSTDYNCTEESEHNFAYDVDDDDDDDDNTRNENIVNKNEIDNNNNDDDDDAINDSSPCW